jgi:hypothetical protein
MNKNASWSTRRKGMAIDMAKGHCSRLEDEDVAGYEEQDSSGSGEEEEDWVEMRYTALH